jgi:hypothetical protein
MRRRTMLDRLHAATSAEIAQTDLASASEPDESAAGKFRRNPVSVKDNKEWKTIGRAAVAAIILAHLAIGSAAGYSHFTFSHVDSPTSADVRPDNASFAPITGYTDAVWVNGWSGPHLDH